MTLQASFATVHARGSQTRFRAFCVKEADGEKEMKPPSDRQGPAAELSS